MDLRLWCRSGSRTIQSGQCYDEIEPVNLLSTGSDKLCWKVLWMKFKKEKRKLFESPARMQVPYDPYTYSQNFDEGSAWDEPDILSRSFSVRFADSSRIFLKKGVV